MHFLYLLSEVNFEIWSKLYCCSRCKYVLDYEIHNKGDIIFLELPRKLPRYFRFMSTKPIKTIHFKVQILSSRLIKEKPQMRISLNNAHLGLFLCLENWNKGFYFWLKSSVFYEKLPRKLPRNWYSKLTGIGGKIGIQLCRYFIVFVLHGVLVYIF